MSVYRPQTPFNIAGAEIVKVAYVEAGTFTGRITMPQRPRRMAGLSNPDQNVLREAEAVVGLAFASDQLSAATSQELHKLGLTAVRVVGPGRPGRKSFAGEKEGPTPSVNKSAFAPGTRAKALLRGLEMAQEDLRVSGGSYSLDQVRQLMHGVSRQSIDKRVREGSLLAVPGPSNKRHYPAVQFNEDGSVVNGLQAVQQALPTTNSWSVLNFLIRPDDRLGGRRPIDLLRAGKLDLVIEAARRIGEHGA